MTKKEFDPLAVIEKADLPEFSIQDLQHYTGGSYMAIYRMLKEYESRGKNYTGRAEVTLAFIGASVLFLPLFVFLPKLVQRAMKADVERAIEAFGKNEQTKKVFWTMFVSMAGLVLTRVLDPETARR